MFNWRTFPIFLSQISFFMFILLFHSSHISGDCSCQSFNCLCNNINFIPRLPSNITSFTLKYSKCRLQKKFMANISSLPLKELHFNRVNIIDAESDIFKNFPNLTTLSFRIPYTNMEILNQAFESLHFTKITKLTINHLNMNSSLNDFLLAVNDTNITELSLIRCNLVTLDISQFFPSLRNLQYLNLSENFFKQVSLSHSKQLRMLVLRHGKMNIEKFVAPNHVALFPNLRHLEISVKEIDEINVDTFKGLPNLEYLFFSAYEVGFKISTGFLSWIPKLKYLHIMASGYLIAPLTVEYGAFKSTQLQHLTLEYFRIKVNHKGSLFHQTTNLLTLKLKLTRIFLLDAELNRELLPLKKLQTFVMTFSSLKTIPDVLCHMSNLSHIDLNKNAITSWNITDCPTMSRLRFFSLSQNEINIIDRNTFSPQLITNDQLVWDLSLNPFLCNCQLSWFNKWCHERQNRLLFFPKDYVCATPPNFKDQSLNSSLFSNGQCSTERSSLIVILVSLAGSLILICISIASLLYYKRKSVQYFIYRMQLRRKQQKEYDAIHTYSFDAFVCYHNSDLKWLLEELRPKLEIENNFSLCIHDRDFIAGWDIVENIVESIEKSRKVLLLLSNQFASSHWCQFEMTMAHQRIIEREENLLIVILLENIDIKMQSRRLTLLLKQKTYLEWTDDKEGQDLFWCRLIHCLKAPNRKET